VVSGWGIVDGVGCSVLLICPLVADIFVLTGKSYKALLTSSHRRHQAISAIFSHCENKARRPCLQCHSREFAEGSEEENGALREFSDCKNSPFSINHGYTIYKSVSMVTVMITVLVTNMCMSIYVFCRAWLTSPV
jgi:hypothetical protein